MKKNSKKQDRVLQAADIMVKLGILVGILFWAFQIIQPFISIIFWALFISVTIYPIYARLLKLLRGRKVWSAIIVTLLLLSFIVVPGEMFVKSVIQGVMKYSTHIESNDFKIPPPDPTVNEWPIVGEFIYERWENASINTAETLTAYAPQLKAIGQWILDALKNVGVAFVQFFVAIFISAVFLVTSDSGGNLVRKFFKRLMGSKGDEYAKLTEVTIRNVSNGVLGVALVQSILAGIIFLLAGIPYSALWALACFILAAIQIGPGPVIFSVVAYLFFTASTVTAILWSIPLILITFVDNVLKPIFMGHGAKVPMLVIFIGSIGGFILSGILGLFTGAIILSLIYKLFIAWVNEISIEEEIMDEIDPSIQQEIDFK